MCRICHGCPQPGFDVCYSCSRVFRMLDHPCPVVVPCSLYVIPGALHGALRGYKDGRDARSRRASAAWVAALLARFLHDHGSCISVHAGSGWDLVTTVPSSSGRSGPHPLVTAIGLVPWLSSQHLETLEPGPDPLGHGVASHRGFTPVRDVRGARLIVVDDTYTTGARAQSAASALQGAGARVVAIVPVGRVVDPRQHPRTVSDWHAQLARPFEFGRCCLEDRALGAAA